MLQISIFSLHCTLIELSAQPDMLHDHDCTHANNKLELLTFSESDLRILSNRQVVQGIATLPCQAAGKNTSFSPRLETPPHPKEVTGEAAGQSTTNKNNTTNNPKHKTTTNKKQQQKTTATTTTPCLPSPFNENLPTASILKNIMSLPPQERVQSKLIVKSCLNMLAPINPAHKDKKETLHTSRNAARGGSRTDG
ncbi:unnamed protein product [Polarella glacialis]|uniref:Uncharacterized protein n=1 Tax=Polarella glacialis TaxID=89957 RepID=A0A813DHZ7_POLGL|nr:unnamed protein product [Polarella glacialis]